MSGDGEAWGELTEAERAGLAYRTAALFVSSPFPRDVTPERLRQDNPGDAFMHAVADAIDAEAAARAARDRLRAVAGGRRLTAPGARRDAPALRVLDGYAVLPPLAAGLPQKSTPGDRGRGDCSRRTAPALPQVMTRSLR